MAHFRGWWSSCAAIAIAMLKLLARTRSLASRCPLLWNGNAMDKVAVDYDTGNVISSGVGRCDAALIMDMVLVDI